MKQETSAGIVILSESKPEKILLLNYPSGHWDFVKGKMESGETPHQTVIRETKEETGISDINFIEGFNEEIEYEFVFDKEEIHKKVIFFLGKTNTTDVRLSHEHQDYVWLEFDDAIKKITYDNARIVLKKASEFIYSIDS